MADEANRAEGHAAPAASLPARARLFYALWPDAPAREALSALAERVATVTQGRATAMQRLHLTLAFIGEVPQEKVVQLVAIGHEVAQRATAFSITLAELGMFRGAGIAWIGPSNPLAPLQQLAADLRAALAAAGFPMETRAFRTHLTLARRCVRAVHAIEAPEISWNADSLTLMASELGAKGPSYREVERFRLR
ncbi:MAG: RNA 2',3'-cyclic phosphodiesterase [Pseudomonadota bacterium]|nr:RNA 2',3'-cyclic phosphodiesterase [Pseudomonadota bacterium]